MDLSSLLRDVFTESLQETIQENLLNTPSGKYLKEKVPQREDVLKAIEALGAQYPVQVQAFKIVSEEFVKSLATLCSHARASVALCPKELRLAGLNYLQMVMQVNEAFVTKDIQDIEAADKVKAEAAKHFASSKAEKTAPYNPFGPNCTCAQKPGVN